MHYLCNISRVYTYKVCTIYLHRVYVHKTPGAGIDLVSLRAHVFRRGFGNQGQGNAVGSFIEVYNSKYHNIIIPTLV